MLSHVCMKVKKDRVTGGTRGVISLETVLLDALVIQHDHTIHTLTQDILRALLFLEVLRQYNFNFNNFLDINNTSDQT